MHRREERCACPLMYGAHGGWMVEGLHGASSASMKLTDARRRAVMMSTLQVLRGTGQQAARGIELQGCYR